MCLNSGETSKKKFFRNWSFSRFTNNFAQHDRRGSFACLPLCKQGKQKKETILKCPENSSFTLASSGQSEYKKGQI